MTAALSRGAEGLAGVIGLGNRAKRELMGIIKATVKSDAMALKSRNLISFFLFAYSIKNGVMLEAISEMEKV